MVTDLAGAHCDKVVACAYIRPDWPHKDPSELCMEATLLVVEDPAAAEEKEGEGCSRCRHPVPLCVYCAQFWSGDGSSIHRVALVAAGPCPR